MHRFIFSLITDEGPRRGGYHSGLIRLKTWRGVAERLRKMPPPNHEPEHMYLVERYQDNPGAVYGKPIESRRVKVTLTAATVGYAIYQA